jgi:hypothetical protein
LPPDSLDTYRTRLAAVTRDDVAAAAQRLLHPERSAIVAVGPAARVCERSSSASGRSRSSLREARRRARRRAVDRPVRLACQTTTTRHPRAGTTPTAQAFFWEVTGTDGSQLLPARLGAHRRRREVALDRASRATGRPRREAGRRVDPHGAVAMTRFEPTNSHGSCRAAHR